MEFFLILVLVVVIVAGAWGLSAYNGFIRERNLIQESWRQVDVELNRRYELIPNLVETVRGYAAHERNTLEGVVRLRAQAQQIAAHEGGAAPSQARAQAEEQLSSAVRGLMVSVEAYPELKSNQNFLELQRALAETEDRIAAGRRYYNANVRNYNTRTESVPSNLIANAFHFEKATYFEVNEPEVRRAPDVSFGEIAYRGDQPQQVQPQQPGQVYGGGAPELPTPQQQGYQPPSSGQSQPGQPVQQGYQPPSYGQSQPGQPVQQGYQPPSYGQSQPVQPVQQGYQPPSYGQSQPGQPVQQGYQPPNYGQPQPGGAAPQPVADPQAAPDPSASPAEGEGGETPNPFQRPSGQQ